MANFYSGFYGMYNSSAARQARQTSQEARRDARSASRTVEELEERLDRLAMLSAAMWTLIRDRTRLTEDDLVEKLNELDLRDGVEDGRVGRAVLACTQCGRPVSSRSAKCQYCGAPRPMDSAFDETL